MDLMIEAKDKEQAVFELYRKYSIGGEGLFKDMVPYVRMDENPPEKLVRGRKEVSESVKMVDDKDLAMGGEEGMVYWPEGKEEWLSPLRKIRRQKTEADEEIIVEKRATNGLQQTTKTKGGVAIREEVKVKVENRGQQMTKQPRVEIDEADPVPETAKTKLPAERQRAATRTSNEGGCEPIPAEIGLESDSDLSSPAVTDDDELYEILSSALTADSKGAVTAPQQRIFQAKTEAVVAVRRSTRMRRTVAT